MTYVTINILKIQFLNVKLQIGQTWRNPDKKTYSALLLLSEVVWQVTLNLAKSVLSSCLFMFIFVKHTMWLTEVKLTPGVRFKVLNQTSVTHIVVWWQAYLLLAGMEHELVDLHDLHPPRLKYRPHTPDQYSEPREVPGHFHRQKCFLLMLVLVQEEKVKKGELRGQFPHFWLINDK